MSGAARQGVAAACSRPEAWIRQCLPAQVAPGVLVHAACLGTGGGAVLCLGAPGAGKSTLARLLADRALGEELAVVRARGRWFFAEVIPVRGERGGWGKVAAVVELAHGPDHRRETLAGSEAVQAVARHTYWPVDDERAFRAAFGTVVRLAHEVPAYRLFFRPDGGVRALIEELLR